MRIGIDPKVDFAFKVTFGSPEHPAITIHFLNAVLRLPAPITQVEILNPVQGRDRADDKLVVLDVLARDSSGRIFNIEMQTTLPAGMAQRLTFYNCQNYVRQFREGDHYHGLNPAISICVLNRVMWRQVGAYHLSFRLRCDQADLVFTDGLQFHTLELPKFLMPGTEIAQCSGLEKWLYFLMNAEFADPTELLALLGDPIFEEALGVLQMISRTPEERQYYDARQKFLLDEEARLLGARSEGLEQGIQQGRREGIEQGMLAGKIQLLQQLLGESASETPELTSHSVAELTALLQQLQERLRQRDT
ncbi:MAG: Rpn family recombination-promoting nuclease/putative transposase [Planctomycetaceae bacterium]